MRMPHGEVARQAREAKDPYRFGDVPDVLPPNGAHGSYFRSAPFRMPDLLSLADFAGMCQLSLPAAKRLVMHRLPEYAVVRVGRELRMHSWAVAHMLKMAEKCPGCGRQWEEE